LEAQKRFKHLADEEKERIQSYVNEVCAELKI
jgi:pyruvate ferredoxin oxidoreductase beta subunit